jgi:hypothetical protein
VFCVDLRTKSDYYEPVYIVQCAVQTEYLNVTHISFINLKVQCHGSGDG